MCQNRSTSFGALCSAIVLAACVGVSSTASATTYTFSLNNTLQSNENPAVSLVSQGGTLGATGYTFGANQGLTLPFASPVYSIDISFSFDTTSGFRKILDFKGLTSDEGLYNLNGTLDYFNFAGGPTVQIPAGTIVDARLTRDATGLVTGYVNGVSQFSFIDSTNSAVALSSLAFFMDDSHTGLREASSGFVDSIIVSDSLSTSAVPLPVALPLFATGLGAFGLLGWRRKRKAV